MNGAKSLVKTLLNAGVDTCFSNPGTSEMHFVAALDQIPGMHCVLGLQENIVTGMADGYFRIAGKPACTLLHCGPGLSNGLANLHNARRAYSGMVNIVGDQATYHRPLDAPLTADTEALARTASSWVRTSSRAQDVGRDAAVAVQAACTAGQIATLILPSDTSWDEGGIVAEPLTVPQPAGVDPSVVEHAASALRSSKNVLILLGGRRVSLDIQAVAWRIAQTCGAALMTDYTTAQVARGRGRVQLERVPYGIDAAVEKLRRFEHIVLVGVKPPVGFFAYPGKPAFKYQEQAQLHLLARPDQNSLAALESLADALSVGSVPIPDPGERPEPASGAPTPEGLARTLAALMPEEAIVADESVSYGRGFYPHTYAAPAHDWLHTVGGAIGNGMPLATGAAIGAGKQRRVINLQADGSGMYTLQSLWTQAREQLPVTTIILNNNKYNILIGEYKGVGAEPGPTAMSMLDLSNPGLSWVHLANGMGVEAQRATTMEQCADLMASSYSRAGPFLIELMI
ncbi:acetolactate synthase large subunit [Allopusillimonas ginsengisoli]|uniref:acetolactate synthase large subunit n=1 Tax=Allopusillimonas ginsengisoli TaxID=453575 RepID=UPI001021371F|nr:acetolactate synthase large subunit [Allopusillimonas ginsengisoli]TEA77570.1 acetolactate synthase large subunit [Allopusillimonas ginsengisoli]